jgi:EAL domain-containing protein (putative c-di-GMP-specific phosphodiesterase class I)
VLNGTFLSIRLFYIAESTGLKINLVERKICNDTSSNAEEKMYKFEDFAKNVNQAMFKFHKILDLPNFQKTKKMIEHRAMGMHNIETEITEWKSNMDESTLKDINSHCDQFLRDNKYVW